MSDGPRIVTRYLCPPIPPRNFDWCAYYEEREEFGNYGYGRTEEEAIKDLTENCEEP